MQLQWMENDHYFSTTTIYFVFFNFDIIFNYKKILGNNSAGDNTF